MNCFVLRLIIPVGCSVYLRVFTTLFFYSFQPHAHSVCFQFFGALVFFTSCLNTNTSPWLITYFDLPCCTIVNCEVHYCPFCPHAAGTPALSSFQVHLSISRRVRPSPNYCLINVVFLSFVHYFLRSVRHCHITGLIHIIPTLSSSAISSIHDFFKNLKNFNGHMKSFITSPRVDWRILCTSMCVNKCLYGVYYENSPFFISFSPL